MSVQNPPVQATSAGEVLARVENELRALWAAPLAPGQTARARACTMNLIVVANSATLSWGPVVDNVLLTLPARAIVVGLERSAAAGAFEGSASAVCTSPDVPEQPVCSERVNLVARGSACDRVASCVLTLCASDVPTALVWGGRVEEKDRVFEALAHEADRIVLDADEGSLASLAHVAQIHSQPAMAHTGVADLAWTRISGWQELCARFFDEPRLRPLAARLTSVALVQAAASHAELGPEGALLLGWLATRVGCQTGSAAGKLTLRREDGVPITLALGSQRDTDAPAGALLSVRLEAQGDDIRLRGEIVRASEQASGQDVGTWRLCIMCGAEQQHFEQRVRLGDRDTAHVLVRTLQRPAHDPALMEVVAWWSQLGKEDLRI